MNAHFPYCRAISQHETPGLHQPTVPTAFVRVLMDRNLHCITDVRHIYNKSPHSYCQLQTNNSTTIFKGYVLKHFRQSV
jgi:hypothetical protein